MKDVTSTSFGLLIAFLLPGLVTLFGLLLWVPPLRAEVPKLLPADLNVASVLIDILFALTLGLIISPLRFIIFEKWIADRVKLQTLGPSDFAALSSTEAGMTAFREVVDQ